MKNEQATRENISIKQMSDDIVSEIHSLQEIAREQREQAQHLLNLVGKLHDTKALAQEAHDFLTEAKEQLKQAYYESILPF